MSTSKPTVQPAPVQRSRSRRCRSDEPKVLVSATSLRLRRGSEIKYELSVSKPPLAHQCVIVSIGVPNIHGITIMFTCTQRKPQEVEVLASEEVELQLFKLEHRVKRTKHCDLRFTASAVPSTAVQILQKDSLFVFTFGSNLHGRLGTSTPTAACTPTPLRCKWLFPVQLACGSAHTAIVDMNSHLYCFGRGTEGQLAQQHVDHVKVPTIVAALVKQQVFQVACGANHTLCTVVGGQVYAWGDNTYGQLGVGLKSRQYHVPIHAKNLPCAAQSIVCGGNQSYILSQLHQVYVAGCNLAGQLGLGDMKSRRTFTLSPYLHHIESIASGTYHTIAVSTTQVFVWGNAANGRLGMRPTTDFYLKPTAMEMFHDIRIKQVAAGGMHTALLTQAGDLLMWGGNNYGQVGDGTTVDKPYPVRLRVFEGKCVQAIALGEWHSMALGDDGCVYAWGFGEEGQLGLGEDRNAHLPMAIHALSGTAPLRIHCGSVHSVVVTSIEVANRSQQEKDKALSELHALHERRRLINRKSMIWKGKQPTSKDLLSAESLAPTMHELPESIPEEDETISLSNDSLVQCLEEDMAGLITDSAPPETLEPRKHPPRRLQRPQTARLSSKVSQTTFHPPISWREQPLTSRLAMRLALRREFHVLGVMQRDVRPAIEKTKVFPRLHAREMLLHKQPLDPFDEAMAASPTPPPPRGSAARPHAPRRPSTAPPRRPDGLAFVDVAPSSVVRMRSVTQLLDDDMQSSSSSGDQELRDALAIGWDPPSTPTSNA
ncbi:hypothetical protein ACHHYP_13549 [Achlya hypogyna]|uniref:RCC1-like domain-containing protein n=1 Tax=Achlya hypogyna TaxID=1202772 RepID=A0A1V9YFA0_ACHHY|nr:hypothetical protein ACHHYP_13549 [Achlya hypogyna]